MNQLIKIFDSIGFSCKRENDVFIPISKLNSFNFLSADHVGYYIPYLCRNIKKNQYETGVGLVKYNNIGDIVVTTESVVQSSNNNDKVIFEGNDNEFFLFANKNVFDNILFNTVVINSSKILSASSALYLVDASENDITLTLPPVTSNAPVLEFKLIAGNIVALRSQEDHVISVLSPDNNYIRLTNDGSNWIILDNSIQNSEIKTLSEADNFSALSDPQGSNYSLQYKLNSTTFGATNSYWDPNNHRLLMGSDAAASAKTIIASSGNFSTTINNTKDASDFVVYGSGSLDRNLFFSYDGRVGINIPSGSKPSTVFHIVNTVCQEGLRLENRTSCYPANITLYHKPSNEISNGSTVAQIKLSAKNSAGNQTNYSTIESRAINTTSGSEKGSFDVVVVSGVTGIRTIDSNADYTAIGYNNTKLQLNNNGNAILSNGGSQITVLPQSISLASSSITTTGIISATNIIATTGSFATFQSTTISPSSLLTVDGSGRLINSTLSLNNLGSLTLPIAGNKLLSTTNTGAITGIYTLNDYFLTEGDITWSKFPKRAASVCLKQITFIDTVDTNEFSVGDQIAILLSTEIIYRKILSIELNNSIITGLVVDQDVSSNTISSVNVYSITRGGYLTINSKTEDGTISDSSLTRISIRPSVDTVFNENQKDINFVVYGLDEDPALLIKANTGRSFIPSGIYSPFASSRNDIFPIIVNASGSGISNSYSSANYNYDISRNLFSGMLSSVGSNGEPSFYGTYDQNGNAAEWVEQPNTTESKDAEEIIAGGSYLTTSVSGLKAIELLVRSSGYSDVGFRVASSYNLNDNSYLSTATGLNISFSNVSHPKNTPDTSTTYLKQPSGYNPAYIAFSNNNLGSVAYNYRISKYEVTNGQYCRFLNIVAKNNDRGLYDNRMASHNAGGITRIYDAEYQYSVKANMFYKPVVFVNYLSVIRFINWLHNGALQSINENDIDYILDTGAYTIISIGNNSYNIIKSANRKYWLPDLNEWHKAAYYRPSNTMRGEGSSTVSVCRSEPQIIASGINKLSGQSGVQFANLSVSGWLYVDHLIVGDGSFRSSQEFFNVIPTPVGNNTNTQTSSNNTNVSNSYNNQWSNPNAFVSKGFVVCVATSGCYFDAKPLRLDEDTISLCTDQQLLAAKNIPWWCASNNNGPGWFVQ